MIKRRRFKKAISFFMAAVMVLCLTIFSNQSEVQAAMPVNAVGMAHDGVDFSTGTDGLLNQANNIYYGTYKHISDLYTSRETDPTPVLWRIMGEETTTDSAITLMSEYVLTIKRLTIA